MDKLLFFFSHVATKKKVCNQHLHKCKNYGSKEFKMYMIFDLIKVLHFETTFKNVITFTGELLCLSMENDFIVDCNSSK